MLPVAPEAVMPALEPMPRPAPELSVKLPPPPVAWIVRLPLTVWRLPAWFHEPPSEATLMVRLPQLRLGSAVGLLPAFAQLLNSTVLEAPKLRVVPGISLTVPLLFWLTR